MRADAQRNRERLIEAAREVFREQGYDASLDEVAKRAGVGAGTLYRHFPSRDVLMDAIMQSWVDRVNDSADKVLVHEGDARGLLLAWFETYVGLISLHKGGPAKITSAMGDENSPIVTKCQVLKAATNASSTGSRRSTRCASTSRPCRCAAWSGASPPWPTTPTSTRPPSAPCSRSSPTACLSEARSGRTKSGPDQRSERCSELARKPHHRRGRAPSWPFPMLLVRCFGQEASDSPRTR